MPDDRFCIFSRVRELGETFLMTSCFPWRLKTIILTVFKSKSGISTTRLPFVGFGYILMSPKPALSINGFSSLNVVLLSIEAFFKTVPMNILFSLFHYCHRKSDNGSG